MNNNADKDNRSTTSSTVTSTPVIQINDESTQSSQDRSNPVSPVSRLFSFHSGEQLPKFTNIKAKTTPTNFESYMLPEKINWHPIKESSRFIQQRNTDGSTEYSLFN